MANWPLWIPRMPGLTSDILLEAAQATLPKGMERTQLGGIGETSFAAMRAYCEKKLGLSPHWDEEQYEKTLATGKMRGIVEEWRTSMPVNNPGYEERMKSVKKTKKERHV